MISNDALSIVQTLKLRVTIYPHRQLSLRQGRY